MDVNGVSDKDLELLEEYLDDALAPDDVEALRARMADDPALSAALEELRAEREMRAVVWNSLEPGERDARQFATRVSAAVRRHETWSRVGRYSRFGSAAAACLLVGFFAGWLGRERDTGPFPFGAGPAPVNQVIDGPTISPQYPPTLGVLIHEIRYHNPPNRPMPMLLVRKVLADSPAAQAGLHEGDLIVSLDGEPVRDVPSLGAAINSRGGTRVLRILRDGKLHELGVQFRPQ